MAAVNYASPINYVERGDAPAQAVLDRNARSLSKRVADETREELNTVLQRVENIYGHFELSSSIYESNRNANLEYINDLSELESLIKDQVKKKKYQKQVTIFIVGFENVCGQKLRLLQQVNEFFMQNSNPVDEEDSRAMTPDVDLDDMAEGVEESLKVAAVLTQRLAELNREMVQYMYEYAQAKASNNPQKVQEFYEIRGKKKLERSLEKAKEETSFLVEKLSALQMEIEEKDAKIQQLFKQVEMKNMEIYRYKTAAEVAKKNLADSELLKDQLEKAESQIRSLLQQISSLQTEVDQAENSRDSAISRQHLSEAENNERINDLNRQLQHTVISNEEEKRDEETEAENLTELREQFQQEIEALKAEHHDAIDSLNASHADEIKQLLEKLPSADSKKSNSTQSKQPVVQETTEEKSRITASNLNPRKSKSSLKQGSVSGSSIHEKDSDLTQTQLLEQNDDELLEIQFADKIEFHDETAWAAVPSEELRGRFAQYRTLARDKISHLTQALSATVDKTTSKIQTLKAQFHDHKQKWETERLLLIEQVELSQNMQTTAEREADAALSQLENFIDEQENLDREEEAQHLSVIDKHPPTSDHHSPITAQQNREASPASGKTLSTSKETEHVQEATFDEPINDALFQQTDDAKVKVLHNQCQESTSSEMAPRSNSRQNSVDEETASQFDHRRLTPVGGDTDALTSRDQRVGSSRDRRAAELRRVYRNSASASRAAAAERRLAAAARSPAHLDLRKQWSVLTDAHLDEHGDMPFPLEPEDLKRRVSLYDKATSPIPQTRPVTMGSSAKRPGVSEERTETHSESPPIDISQWKAIPISEHPIVKEYLKSYNSVLAFKEELGKFFMDKDMMSLGQYLFDLQPVIFDKTEKVQPQIEEMNSSISNMLGEILNQLLNTISGDRVSDACF